LTIRRSAWELEIDLKRLRKTIKNVIEQNNEKEARRRASITTERTPKMLDAV